MRALWSGSLSFGLINIPVKLFSAAESRSLNFKMVDKRDRCPIGYLRVCKTTGDEVPYEHIAKAYEYEADQYVLLTRDDFKRAHAKKTELLDIVSFTDGQEIDAKLYEHPYYIAPEKQANKAYALLRDALAESGKVGIAKFVMRNREYIGAVKSEGPAIMLIQMRFAHEIRPPDDLELPAKKMYTNKEFKTALTLITEQSEPFDTSEYTDTYTKEVLRVIEEKAKGRKPLKKGVEPQMSDADLSDILGMLEKSLAEERKKIKA